MKKLTSALAPALAALATVVIFTTPATALDCPAISSKLRAVQHEDSRVRIGIGAVYETLSSNFITPLNLRLVNNDIAASELFDFQANFAATRSEFSSKFIEYSRSLETLIAMDCKNNPEAFLAKLDTTRALRAELRHLTTSLNSSATSYQTHIKTLKEAL